MTFSDHSTHRTKITLRRSTTSQTSSRSLSNRINKQYADDHRQDTQDAVNEHPERPHQNAPEAIQCSEYHHEHPSLVTSESGKTDAKN